MGLYFIEPSPACIRHLRETVDRKVDFIKEAFANTESTSSFTFAYEIKELAIANSNGYTLFYGLTEDHRGETSDGASINPEHNSRMYQVNYDDAIKVRTVSAGDFVNELSKDRPFVVIKMDIEGSEYLALEDMINKNSFDNISRIYIEWHGACFADELKEKYMQLESSIKKKLPAGKFFDWI